MLHEEYLKAAGEKFIVKSEGASPYKPQEQHVFGMYLSGEWYSLRAREGSFSTENPVESLDVSILQKNLLDPVLGIKDPRTDKRIEFVGGIRGLEELKVRADKTEGVAFAVYPVTVKELMDIDGYTQSEVAKFYCVAQKNISLKINKILEKLKNILSKR